MIELSNSRVKNSPADAYDELAHLASHYQIDGFDMYGDYDKDSGTSIMRFLEKSVSSLFGKDDVSSICSLIL